MEPPYNYSSPFLPFPSPFLDDADAGLLVSHMFSQQSAPHDPLPCCNEVPNMMIMSSNGSGGGGEDGGGDCVVVKKRVVKKDRHSKICTAQGMRDRRMRLSVKVARKFFDLQDMLDFDKASKTIEWLLTKSEPAIQDLTARGGAGSNKLCMSSSSESNNNNNSDCNNIVKEMEVVEVKCQEEDECLVGGNGVSKARERGVVKSSSRRRRSVLLARESRDMARARARERTREKMMMMVRGIGQTHSSSPESNHLKTAPNHNHNHQNQFQAGFTPIEARIEPEEGCYAMTRKKQPLGKNNNNNVHVHVQVQNINPNAHENNNTNPPPPPPPPPHHHHHYHPSSIFMATTSGGQWNPSSNFGAIPNSQENQQNPNPTSIFMSNALEGISITPMFTPTNSSIGFIHSLTASLGDQFL